MKTAMQEMIEYLENTWYVKEIKDWEDIKINIIKKEKEQIIQAINAWCSNDNILTSEQYYNETYNQ